MIGSRRRFALSTIIAAFIANGLALTSVLLLQNIWAGLIVLGVAALDVFLLYAGYLRKRKMQYPLVPPEGKPDMYLPKTTIPRPVIEDFRKIEEKKRKFAKVDKMIRRGRKSKKK
jgi:hypothetical protein